MGLPLLKLNVLMVLCHITAHEQTRAAHMNNEAELCLLLPKKQHIETELQPKSN